MEKAQLQNFITNYLSMQKFPVASIGTLGIKIKNKIKKQILQL